MFKVNDRVRIIRTYDSVKGREGVVVDVMTYNLRDVFIVVLYEPYQINAEDHGLGSEDEPVTCYEDELELVDV